MKQSNKNFSKLIHWMRQSHCQIFSPFSRRNLQREACTLSFKPRPPSIGKYSHNSIMVYSVPIPKQTHLFLKQIKVSSNWTVWFMVKIPATFFLIPFSCPVKLAHSSHLTSTSPRVHEIMTMDGSFEHLIHLWHDFCICPPLLENPAILFGLLPPNCCQTRNQPR